MKQETGRVFAGLRRPAWAVTLLAVTIGVALSLATPAYAHQGNSDFRSIVNSITPGQLAEGLDAEVVNFDDHVVLENRSGKDVEILGYDNEPYARILADGTVEVNLNSPTHYLNEDRYADVALPERADADSPPAWEEEATDGRFEWHDHRSHYMSEGTPPQVKDESERTKIFDYTVPLRVDGKPVKINGTLFWHGRDNSVPVLPFVLLGIVVAAGAGFLLIRRRRAGTDADPPETEAW